MKASNFTDPQQVAAKLNTVKGAEFHSVLRPRKIGAEVRVNF